MTTPYEHDSTDHSTSLTRPSLWNLLNTIFGGGTVSDILLWKNKSLSGAILIGVTVIWFLFEVMEYNFIPLLCRILCLMMIILFTWSKADGLIKTRPPSVDEIGLSESTYEFIFDNINWLLTNLYDISCGKNLRHYFMTLGVLYFLSIIGEYFSSMSLLYLVFVCLQILPALYVRFRGEVDYFADTSTQGMQRLFTNINTKVLEKIPRAQATEKKYI